MENDKFVITKIDDYYLLTERLLVEKEKANELTVTKATGFSMGSVIVSGDKIVIDASVKNNLCVGDIIAFSKNNLLVCHRIIKAMQCDGLQRFVTKGDASEKDDGEIVLEQIAGKVTHLIRGRKRIDPYNEIPCAINDVSVLKKLKMSIKDILKSNSLVMKFYVILRKIIFVAVKRHIRYELHIPRKSVKYPAYRYASIPLEDIWDADCDFYEPLNEISAFRLTAAYQAWQNAVMEVVKFTDQEKGKDFWVIVRFSIDGVFYAVSKEIELMKRCRHILNKIGINKLYALVSDDNSSFYWYVKKTKAKFIQKNGEKSLYLCQ